MIQVTDQQAHQPKTFGSVGTNTDTIPADADAAAAVDTLFQQMASPDTQPEAAAQLLVPCPQPRTLPQPIPPLPLLPSDPVYVSAASPTSSPKHHFLYLHYFLPRSISQMLATLADDTVDPRRCSWQIAV
jgi:hypothetical protein